MIIGQICMQAYINVSGQGGSDLDISPIPKNPANTGVDLDATGIFGQSNGAMLWNADTEKLSWSSSIGNSIAEIINTNGSIIFFINISRLLGATGTSQLIVGQYDGSGSSNSSFYCGHNKNQSLAVVKRGDSASGISETTPVINISTWYCFSYIFNANNIKLFIDSLMIKDDNFTQIAKESSTLEFKIGNHFPGTNNWLGKMFSFRIYQATLNSLQTQIINAQMGRIAS